MPNQSAEQLFMKNNKTIAELLESIRNAADDHFGVDPANIDYSDAASAGRIAEMLAEVLAVVEGK